MRIKRTKTGHGGPDDLPPSTAVHWAKQADTQGVVVAWVKAEADAADFDAETAAKVRAHYAGRANVGLLEFIGEGGVAVTEEFRTAQAKSRPDEDDLREASVEIARLRSLAAGHEEEIDRRGAIIAEQYEQIESLRRDLEAATAPDEAQPKKRGPGRPPKQKKEPSETQPEVPDSQPDAES